MNFLAHIYLSGDDDDVIIGNFIADGIKGKRYLKYPPKIQKGIIRKSIKKKLPPRYETAPGSKNHEISIS